MLRSPYSPLFTSGLLSEASSSRTPSPFVPAELGPRRGSLPTDTPPSTFSGASQKVQSPTDESSAFYFTLQPRRGTAELRSFLSLDLAESQSLRSVSLRRKASSASKSTAWSSKLDAPPLPTIQSSLNLEPPRPFLSASSTTQASLRCSSRESLRSIPSPKPAPSIDLPKLPAFDGISDSPPRLPPIPPTPSLSMFSPHQSVRASPPPSISDRVPSVYSVSVNSTHRHGNRSEALAALEGRSRSALKRSQRNFMSMTDDEDEELEEAQRRLQIEEEEDLVLPTSPIASPTPSRRSQPLTPSRSRKRRSTESWFPLKSFIDFRDEDSSSWNWRNFIEVASLS